MVFGGGSTPPETAKPIQAYTLSVHDAVQQLQTDRLDGLSSAVAAQRLEVVGRNEIGSTSNVSPFKILLAQLLNAMSVVLIVAMAVSLAIRSWIESAVIGLVILLNIVVGFLQEYKAEKTMDSLRSLSSPTAMVVRDGNATSIPTAEVVPGDLVLLNTGDTVPADIRLIEAVNFETDEALLTGESLPVQKESDLIFSLETGPGDRLNVAYSSSTVVKGRATGLVYATAMGTEIGTIAAALGKSESHRRPVKRKADGTAGPHRYMIAYTLTGFDALGRFLGVNVGTPLQRKLSKLAVLLFGAAVICAIIVMAANKFVNKREVIIYAVATGVSMLPVSLVVLLTVTMAAGTKRMVSRHVIVRNLNSLEALGGVTDICSDKTGTLTQGKMVARKVWVPARGTYSIGLSAEPFNPTTGQISFLPFQPKDVLISELDQDPTHKNAKSPSDHLTENGPLRELISVATFSNLSHLHQNEGQWISRGDPTEIALNVLATRFGSNRADLVVEDENSEWKNVAEYPFDSSVKKMSVLMKHNQSGRLELFTKGAVERVIEACDSCIWDGISKEDAPVPMTDEMRADVMKNTDALSSLGLRVLALASREWTGPTDKAGDLDRQVVEVGLTFRGLVGIFDPPRPESAGSVRACQNAGITVHMLTGDHPGTARAIAAQVGILSQDLALSTSKTDMTVMTATQFDALSDDELDQLSELPLVVARCTPTTKVRMIEALHRRGRFVGMTGDGVNDSPALKRADVGISMGMTGSDVAKEASDLILTDDNFASIVNAVEEGRRIFDNIQRFIVHLLAGNSAQTFLMMIGLAFKDMHGYSVFPFTPVEALWTIMITAGIPDMALGCEQAVAEILHRPPHDPKSGVFTREALIDIMFYGPWLAGMCIGSFTIVVFGFGDGDLGYNCNSSYRNDAGVAVCDLVFRGRSTTFAVMTFDALFLAWEMVDMRRCFFRMHPESPHTWTQWARDIWTNQLLFWSIIVGMISLFPTIYIPVVNTKLFKHAPITWEWSIVFIQMVIFLVGIEAWLWCKRAFLRRYAKKNGLPDPFVLTRKDDGSILNLGTSINDDVEASISSQKGLQ